MNRLFIILLFSSLFSCKYDGLKETQVHSMTGISKNHDKIVSMLSMKGTIYLIAEERVGDFMSIRSIFYQSHDNGKSWIKINTLPGKSRITDYDSSYIYFITEVFQENSFNNQLYFLNKLNLLDNSIEEIEQFKEYIHSAFFENSLKGYAFLRRSSRTSDYSLYSTYDGGSSWESVNIDRPILIAQKKDSKIYFSSHQENLLTNNLYWIDISDNCRIDSLKLGYNIEDFIIIKEGEILILGKKDNKIQISRYINGVLSNIKVFYSGEDYFPIALIGKEKMHAILIGKLYSIGTYNHLFVSTDLNDEWHEIKLTYPSYNYPIIIHDTNNILCYNGNRTLTSIICDY